MIASDNVFFLRLGEKYIYIYYEVLVSPNTLTSECQI